MIILEDFHRRTFKVLALVLSASQCLKFLRDLEISWKALETASQVSWMNKNREEKFYVVKAAYNKTSNCLNFMANTGHLKIYLLFWYVSSNNWVNRWVNKWHVFQITDQKQRFNETSSHILVSILVLYYCAVLSKGRC